MSAYSATILWQRNGAAFTDQRYSRAHVWQFDGEKRPDREDVEDLHHAAHDECFIANSVKSEVRCEPQN